MNILALDASTEVCSVALCFEGNIWQEYCEEPRSHSKVLLPAVDKLLKAAGVSLSQLDYIGLTNGPGSFTGIRICVGIAQGLAYGAQLPVFTVSSLEAMALLAQKELQHESEAIVTVLDARMEELYWAAFKPSGDGGLASVVSPQVSSIAEAEKQIAALGENPLCVGHGCKLLDKNNLTNPSMFESFTPKATGVLMKGLNDVANERKIRALLPGELIEPLYLRNEVAWEKRKRLRSSNSS